MNVLCLIREEVRLHLLVQLIVQRVARHLRDFLRWARNGEVIVLHFAAGTGLLTAVGQDDWV